MYLRPILCRTLLGVAALAPMGCRDSGSPSQTGSVALVATLPGVDPGSIDAAYAIPVTEFESAYSKVVEMVELARSGAFLDDYLEQVASTRGEAVAELRNIHLNPAVDADTRSAFASALTDLEQRAPVEVDKVDPRLSACMARQAWTADNQAREGTHLVDDDDANVAIGWMLAEVERQVLGNYIDPDLNRFAPVTSVDLHGLLKGVALPPRDISFDIDPACEYLLVVTTSEGHLLKVVDPALSPTVELDPVASPKTLNLLRGSFVGGDGDGAESPRSESVTAVKAQLDERKRQWELLASKARAVSTGLREIARLKEELEGVRTEAETTAQEISSVESGIAELKQQITEIEKSD